jgi:arylsulfatase A-like enzyme
MVVVGPGVPAGARSRALAGTVDLAPTFADIARADAEGHDGRSLLGVLRGRPPVRWRSALLVEHLGRSSAGGDPDSQSWAEGRAGNYRALRSRRYTYVEYANGDRELYDHRRDPHQLDNRAGTLSQPDRRRWHALLGHYAACAGARACSGAVEHDDGQVAGARRRP